MQIQIQKTKKKSLLREVINKKKKKNVTLRDKQDKQGSIVVEDRPRLKTRL